MTQLRLGVGFAGALFLAALGAQPVRASGGFDCSVDDRRLALSLRGGLPHGVPARPFQVEGSLTLRDAQLPADLRSSRFTGEHLVQNWLDGRDFRLNFYREREGDAPFGSVEIVVKTRAIDENRFRGDYVITVFEAATGEDGALRLKGKIACSLE